MDWNPVTIHLRVIIMDKRMMIQCMTELKRCITTLECNQNTMFHLTHPILYFGISVKQTDFLLVQKTKNVTMISGYSDTLLNAFLQKGVEVLQNFSPISMIFDILDSDRYNMLGGYFTQYFL